MANSKIPGGTVHSMPADFKKALSATPRALSVWQDITP